MSVKLKSSSKRKTTDRARRLNRPFAAGVLREARRIADGYRILLSREPQVGYFGRGVEMPLVMADGPTPDVCVRAVRDALVAAVATLLEQGERPPPPSGTGGRAAQVNIRLSAEEKLALEESARQAGFRGLSDYVRAMLLNPRAGSAR